MKRKTKRKTTGGRIVKMALAIVLVAGVLFFSPSLKTNAYTNNNMPTGYRPLADSDIDKVFGEDLDEKIYFDTEYDLDNRYSTSYTLLMDFVIPNSSYLLRLMYNVEEEDDTAYYVYFTHTGSVEHHIYNNYEGYMMSDYTLPELSYINDIYYDLPKNFIYVKDIEVIEDYEVTFVTNGGTSVTKLENVEELPTPLPTTIKTNNIFVGWFYDSGFEEQAFSGDTISSNITLYAKWRLSEDYIAGYDDGYATGYGAGYWEGYDDGYNQGGIDVIDIGWFRTVMSGIAVIFSIKVFGDITLATFIGIPLLFAIILWIKKLLS